MAKDVSLLQNIQTSPGPIQHPTQWVMDPLSMGIKQPMCVKLTSHCHGYFYSPCAPSWSEQVPLYIYTLTKVTVM